ncbi:ankyrin repeat and MYND domain-containing protein 2 [Elysia marginata]|uniref:Ankyrin repeat and MYND domain-containing protein 2 n=1 Tax=Elysia marginata TaxID=1093978 RepID=A0AAV4JR77_9GAST|nr:ankyrin repeat and MYND domain-containing protein 2 [Elysia marginata]
MLEMISNFVLTTFLLDFQVSYCNQTCQRLHWPTHKRFCAQLAKATTEEILAVKDDGKAVNGFMEDSEAELAKAKDMEATENIEDAKEKSKVSANES